MFVKREMNVKQQMLKGSQMRYRGAKTIAFAPENRECVMMIDATTVRCTVFDIRDQNLLNLED